MKIHYLQHVPFEDLANIEGWAISRGHDITATRLFSGEALPELESIDWLIIMGGPMNIYEHDRYPWLATEKRFIGRAIAAGKIVLGICLGAQLMADVLGAEVVKNENREIGWFTVDLTAEAKASPLFSVLPQSFTAFHWHGDTFAIPPGALRAAYSRGCANQAFVLGRAVGLQFHLESSEESLEHLLENCAGELAEGDSPYVQNGVELAAGGQHFAGMRCLMEAFLDNMALLGKA
ncbi:MAG TPA: type 1 glutamine amidotransferase [Methanothrix sp.]|nr:type 1 glutamine amidotransferase [Methanothrix sp.]HPT20163.1 type 1 glutamine amidotransferase [Methanothrix sp.]